MLSDELRGAIAELTLFELKHRAPDLSLSTVFILVPYPVMDRVMTAAELIVTAVDSDPSVALELGSEEAGQRLIELAREYKMAGTA